MHKTFLITLFLWAGCYDLNGQRYFKVADMIGNGSLAAGYFNNSYHNNRYADQTTSDKISGWGGWGLSALAVLKYPVFMDLGIYSAQYKLKPNAISFGASNNAETKVTLGQVDLGLNTYLIPGLKHFMPYGGVFLGSSLLSLEYDDKNTTNPLQKGKIAYSGLGWKMGTHIFFGSQDMFSIGGEYRQPFLFFGADLERYQYGQFFIYLRYIIRS